MKSVILLLLFFVIHQNLLFGQKATPVTENVDTVALKQLVLKFTDLSLQRQNANCILEYCDFPFYIIGKDSMVFKSSLELREFLHLQWSKKSALPPKYKVDSVIIEKGSVCIKCLARDSVVCLRVSITIFIDGEGDDPQILNTIILVSKNNPNKIIGVKE